jgi:peroxiredoxin
MKLHKLMVGAAMIGALGLTGIGSSAMAAPDAVTASPAKVADFTLTDQNGQSHDLYDLKTANAVVLITQGDDCPIVRGISETLQGLQTKYEAQGVKFLMLNSNLQDSRDEVVQEAKDYGYHMPILLDAKQTVGEELGVTRTAEVMVINPKTWQIVYRGPIDDRVTYGRQKAEADNPWADQAITAALAGKAVAMAQRDPEGCLINFPNRDATAKTAATAGGGAG